MITGEPKIKVALLQNSRRAAVRLNGDYRLADGRAVSGRHFIQGDRGAVLISNDARRELIRNGEIRLEAAMNSSFSLSDVKIGIDFHWERTQALTFAGDIILLAGGGSTFHLINEIPLEDYLASVISSEMSARAPLEFLKAQAVTARSWLVAMLEKKKEPRTKRSAGAENERILWQDVNDHVGFDVCADDHCQRYQGTTRIVSPNVRRAINDTRGRFLCFGGRICDARYHKCCGGQTEIYSTAWEDQNNDYLSNISDDANFHLPVRSENDARRWLTGRPKAYCNTTDKKLLSTILPDFDLETADFYRWRVAYRQEELEDIIRKKSGLDFGEVKALVPLERGPSGRIFKLKIEGSKRTVIVGKELEIRRWLSPSHLLSSAFVVDEERQANGKISRFTLQGGGWGHGVGLCQIGAAVMAVQGFTAEEILAHYFTGAELQKLY
jgi:SpoIID/LytB domain protein